MNTSHFVIFLQIDRVNRLLLLECFVYPFKASREFCKKKGGGQRGRLIEPSAY